MTTVRTRIAPSFGKAARPAVEQRATLILRKKLRDRQQKLAGFDVRDETAWPRFVNVARRALDDHAIAREIGASREVLDNWSQGLALPSARTRFLMQQALERALGNQLESHKISRRFGFIRRKL